MHEQLIEDQRSYFRKMNDSEPFEKPDGCEYWSDDELEHYYVNAIDDVENELVFD